jgi:hypothetical protein
LCGDVLALCTWPSKMIVRRRSPGHYSIVFSHRPRIVGLVNTGEDRCRIIIDPR